MIQEDNQMSLQSSDQNAKKDAAEDRFVHDTCVDALQPVTEGGYNSRRDSQSSAKETQRLLHRPAIGKENSSIRSPDNKRSSDACPSMKRDRSAVSDDVAKESESDSLQNLLDTGLWSPWCP